MFMKFGLNLGADLVKLNSSIALPIYTICEQEETQLMLDAEGKVFDYWAARLDSGITQLVNAYGMCDDFPEFGALYDDGFPVEFTSLDEDDDMYYRNVDFWDGVKANDEYWQHVNAYYEKELIILGVDNNKDYDYGVNEDGNFIVVQNKTVTEYTPKEFVAFMEADCKEY